MAKEILAIPEERLEEVINVIRAGLVVYKGTKAISKETRKQLLKWCDEEQEYLDNM